MSISKYRILSPQLAKISKVSIHPGFASYPTSISPTILLNLSHKYSSLSNANDPIKESGPKRSFSRSLFKFTTLTVLGGVTVLYLSKEARDYLVQNVPGSGQLLKLAEQNIGEFADIGMSFDSINIFKPKTTGSKIELPSPIVEHKHDPIAKTEQLKNKDDSKDESQPSTSQFQEKHILPSFQDVETMIKERSESVLKSETILSADLNKLLSVAETYVETALYELKEFEKSSKDFLNRIKAATSSAKTKSDKVWTELAKISDRLNVHKQRLSDAAVEAKHKLHVLHEAVQKARENAELVGSKVLRDTLERHKELQYKLDSAILDTKKSENATKMAMRHRDHNEISWNNIESEIQQILKESDTNKASESKGLPRDVQEINSLLVSAYNRIQALENHLLRAKKTQREQLDAEMRHQEESYRALLKEAIGVELARAHNEFCVERLKWDEETRQLVERELETALARHSEHLAHMLKLKQDEMEHAFRQRLREAISLERGNFEQSIRGWTKRMEAIDHVVQGRAELDRIAKQAQAFWLAVEALVSTIELPAELSGGDPSQPRTTGPLGTLHEAVKVTAPQLETAKSSLVTELLARFPEQALHEGVWTAPALKQRFEKVYTVCRRVVRLDPLDPSLWQYLSSWLQSCLIFDVGRRASFWNRLNQLARFSSSDQAQASPYLIDRDTNLDDLSQLEDQDQFMLLDSARLAVERGDLEFALKLMLGLKGHARALAHDWCEAVRVHLETWMISQALLANASATGITAFQERL